MTEERCRLYTQKTGESVYVPLPPSVVTTLREVPNGNPRYFFWNGTSAVDEPQANVGGAP